MEERRLMARTINKNTGGRGIILGLFICVATAICVGCASDRGGRSAASRVEAWNLGAFELVRWQLDGNESFSQDHAIEASGLTSSEAYLFVAAEKYNTIVVIDPNRGYRAHTLELDLPEGSEIEGLAWAGDRLLMCDEAHGAILEARLETGSWGSSESSLATRRLTMVDLEVPGGKVGLEGIAATSDGRRIYALVERLRDGGQCKSVIHRLFRSSGVLRTDGEPLIISLEDCAWRVSGLHYHSGNLMALMTRFPGEIYRVVRINPRSGSWKTVLEITELAVSLGRGGASNNLEGLTVASDGSLYIVSDNAATESRPSADPPLANRGTLLIRMPPRSP